MCLSSRRKLTAVFIVSNASKKLLRICPDHISSSADNSGHADSSMADKKHGKKCPHMIGLKQTHGIKNVTLKGAKKFACRGLLGRVICMYWD